MWRSIKLTLNFLLTAVVFNFFVLILILLLNPHIQVSNHEFLVLYADLFVFYGPLWFIFIGITFFMLQFFSEKKYPIGIFKPPTVTYFMFFNILCCSFFLYLNYDYYIEFLSPTVKINFIKILLVNLALIITGVVFVFFKKMEKKWIQIIFFSILCYNMIHSYTAVMYISQDSHISTGNIENEKRNAQRKTTDRKIKIVIMDGLSLNLIDSMASEQKVLNFNELLKKGASGKISGFKPNLGLSLLNSTLTGLKPSEFSLHSNTKFKFVNIKHEFDVRPRYIFFRKSSHLKVTSFFNKNSNHILDNLNRNYETRGHPSIRLIRPDTIPIYWTKPLHKNSRFVPLFANTLNETDEKYDILKKAFFFDDYLMKSVRKHWEDSSIYYSVVRFPGLGIISKYFSQYHDPRMGGNISESDIKKYGWVIEKYYEYYASIIGNLLSTTGDNELLVILSFYEYEPLPVWRRILVNLFDQKDIYFYKSLNSRGTILLYEKNALKKGYPLKEISIYDIYPTLLYYSGFQLSKNLEGEVIREIFTDQFVLNNPIDIDTNSNRFSY
ncbi:MAG: hypothetical protein GY950_10355 [bacterium]|nr:hypothetical protein [bacterium]